MCTLILIVAVDGKQIGLNDKLLGEMGTIRIPLTPLSMIGPPAESE